MEKYLAHFAGADAVTLEEMLDAREARAARQRALLARHRLPLVSFTLNIPGEHKTFRLAERTFREGVGELRRELGVAGMPVVHHEEQTARTGYEGYYVVDAPLGRVKNLLMGIEDNHPLGRLFDLDVLDLDGNPARGTEAGRPERRCLVCGGPVWECARNRKHPVTEVAVKAVQMMDKYFRNLFADRLAADATRSMLYELATTPKPGLVDRHNNGAHRDMDVFTFITSASTLHGHFRCLAMAAMDYSGGPGGLLPHLRRVGRRAEAAMFAATCGVNTHKGLLFSLGLIVAARCYLRARGRPADLDGLLGTCAHMANSTLGELGAATVPTHGQKVYALYGAAGARGEAAAGFPNVRRHGLPVLRRLLDEGHSPNDAGVVALLHLLANVTDANILKRAGPDRLADIQRRVKAKLTAEGDGVEALVAFARELDDEFITGNISPGGCADLLAVSFMLHFSVTATE